MALSAGFRGVVGLALAVLAAVLLPRVTDGLRAARSTSLTCLRRAKNAAAFMP